MYRKYLGFVCQVRNRHQENGCFECSMFRFLVAGPYSDVLHFFMFCVQASLLFVEVYRLVSINKIQKCKDELLCVYPSLTAMRDLSERPKIRQELAIFFA